jgi:hypothetical protein
VPGPERLTVLASLPPHGEWRRALALDRGAGTPRSVVLSFAPAALLDDPARLTALVRDVEAAGRLHHPGAIPVLGTETVDDRLAVVEPFRPGATVRALLDAAGRLPPDVAARIAVDACAAVARAHAIDAGEGRPLVHGALAPSRILVGEDGAALVSGFGTGGDADPDADVRALAAILHECLAGEPPREPAALREVPGIPAPLAEVVVRALGPGAPAGAAAFAEAVSAAGPLATHAEVAAYAEAIRPRGDGDAAALSGFLDGGDPLEVESAESLAVESTDPALPAPVEPTLDALPRPPATRPGADPAGVFAAPPPPARPSRLPRVVAAACLAGGLVAGFVAARGLGPLEGLAAVWPARPIADASAREGSGEAAPPDFLTAETPAPAPAPEPEPVPVPVRAAAKAAPPPAPPPRAPARRAKGAKGAKGSAARTSRAAPASAAAPAGSGVLDVTAPAQAEVFLDGRRIAIGGVRLEIPAGAHRVEVRLGEARVAERFELAPGETWTYDVAPTR